MSSWRAFTQTWLETAMLKDGLPIWLIRLLTSPTSAVVRPGHMSPGISQASGLALPDLTTDQARENS